MIGAGLEFFIISKALIIEWRFYEKSILRIRFIIYMDWISFIFFSRVSFISRAVLLFRGSYIRRDSRIRLFLFLVLAFITRIFFIVFRLNLVRIILGWDGLGIVSYVLVIYYKNEKSRAAGMITALRNRIGDAALILRIAGFIEYGSWRFIFFSERTGLVRGLVLLAAFTKRAQIPFSAWLPAAIAAPTPVRALVHSSTLVTAGVYLLIRFNILRERRTGSGVLSYLGIFTTVMARIRALYETDLKKIIALSTLRQLGVIIRAVGIGWVILAFAHLLIHAIFKALLFLCGGKILHSIGGGQDIRNIGGLLFNLPVSRRALNIANMALCGIPFLSGFYSKDLVVEINLIRDTAIAKYLLLIFIVGLSIRYAFRISLNSLSERSNQFVCREREEQDWLILSSKFILIVFTVCIGTFTIAVFFNFPSLISLPMSLKFFAIGRTLWGLIVGIRLSFSKKLFFLKWSKRLWVRINIWNLPVLRGQLRRKVGVWRIKEVKRLDLGWRELLRGQGSNYRLIFSFKQGAGWYYQVIKKVMILRVIGGLCFFIW